METVNRPNVVLENAEPFYLPGGRTACLLIHGFTGAPTEMRWLGEYLNKKGYTVLGVRLAGHGTTIEDMVRTRWQDWVASVEDAWHLLKDNVDDIFIIGLSMGGVLGLINSAKFPVKGAVVMSTPFEIPARVVKTFRWWIPFISTFYPYKKKEIRSGWFKPEAREGHISYAHNPTRSSLELLKMLEAARKAMPQITAPVLVIHSRDDEYVLPYNADLIYAQLEKAPKELLYIEKAGHVVTRDGDIDRLFDKIEKFIRSQQAGG